MERSSPPPVPLLSLSDDTLGLFSALVSKDVQPSFFQERVKQHGSDPADPADLEHLRNLDVQRRELVCRSPIREALEDQHLEQLVTYIRHLHDLNKPGVNDTTEGSWTSPLAGKPTQFFRLKGLACETAMATALLAAALQVQAHKALSPKQGDDEQPMAAPGSALEGAPADCVAASLKFRQAAGAYEWLALTGAFLCSHVSSRPIEIIAEMDQTMSMVCCAQAQVCAVHRAEQRGSPPALLSSLCKGAWELFESAAKKLKDQGAQVGTISENFRRWVALNAGLCHARALAHCARYHLKVTLEAGKGEAACIEAARFLQQCEAATLGFDEWQRKVKQEQTLVEGIRAACEGVRTGVYYQALPKSAPELPASKILAKPAQWSPGEPLPKGQQGPA